MCNLVKSTKESEVMREILLSCLRECYLTMPEFHMYYWKYERTKNPDFNWHVFYLKHYANSLEMVKKLLAKINPALCS